MHWREPVGTATGAVGLITWVALGVFTASAACAIVQQHGIAARVLVVLIAIVFAAGGLVIFWLTADQIDFWRRGYRVRQLSPRAYLHWSQGPKQCVYEERTRDGRIQALPFVRMILGDGYPAPCEVCLPREEDWDAQLPSWARGRRKEIMERMHECFGAERSRTRFVTPT